MNNADRRNWDRLSQKEKEELVLKMVFDAMKNPSRGVPYKPRKRRRLNG